MRHPNGIEIRVDITKLDQATIEYLKANYDFEFNSQTEYYTLWVHDDGKYQFQRELIQHMAAMIDVYNREAAAKGCEFTDYVGLYIEAEDMGEMGMKIQTAEGIKIFENLRAVKLPEVIASGTVFYLKREVLKLNTEL